MTDPARHPGLLTNKEKRIKKIHFPEFHLYIFIYIIKSIFPDTEKIAIRPQKLDSSQVIDVK